MFTSLINGKSAPRIVLFSPIAHENLDDPNLDDGRENNKRLKLYTTAMAEVAKANGVLFVDLFAPSSELYASDAKPLSSATAIPTNIPRKSNSSPTIAIWR